MSTSTEPKPCVCQRRGRAHDARIPNPHLLPEPQISTLDTVTPHTRDPIAQLRHLSVDAERQIKGLVCHLKVLVFRLTELDANGTVVRFVVPGRDIVERIGSMFSNREKFGECGILLLVKSRVCGWIEDRDRDRDGVVDEDAKGGGDGCGGCGRGQDEVDFGNAIRTFYTATAKIRDCLPVAARSAEADRYLAYVGRAVDGCADDDSSDESVTIDGRAWPLRDGVRQLHAAIDVCRWAVCELDRDIAGLERYLVWLERQMDLMDAEESEGV